MSDFETRLAAVEAAVKANALPLTLAALQRKLEANWQPDASVLLAPASVTAEMLRFRTLELLSGTLKVSEKRTIAAHSMTVGVSTATVTTTGLTTLAGIIVASLDPSAHHTFSWYPNVPNTRIVFNNSGVLQTVNISYYVLGS